MYTIIVKVLNRGRQIHITYHKVTDLKRFENFIDKQFQKWYYFNVYDRKTRTRLESFTNKRRPIRRKIRLKY